MKLESEYVLFVVVWVILCCSGPVSPSGLIKLSLKFHLSHFVIALYLQPGHCFIRRALEKKTKLRTGSSHLCVISNKGNFILITFLPWSCRSFCGNRVATAWSRKRLVWLVSASAWQKLSRQVKLMPNFHLDSPGCFFCCYHTKPILLHLFSLFESQQEYFKQSSVLVQLQGPS